MRRPVEYGQYTSGQLADAASELGVLRSMGRTGVCWDNAGAESFWSVFKNEYYHRHVFATIDAARRGSYAWIDGWYNARRRHSAIGYISPLDVLTRIVVDVGETSVVELELSRFPRVHGGLSCLTLMPGWLRLAG